MTPAAFNPPHRHSSIGLNAWMLRAGGVCILLGITGLADALHAQQRITPPRQRQEILQKAEVMLDRPARVVKIDFSELNYPFAFPQPDVPEIVATSETAAPVVEPARPADATILGILAERIRPTGTAVRGEQTFLMFSRGQVPEGGVIGMNYDGQTYHITVESISLPSNSYRLRLNEATLDRELGGRRTGGGTIQRN